MRWTSCPCRCAPALHRHKPNSRAGRARGLKRRRELHGFAATYRGLSAPATPTMTWHGRPRTSLSCAAPRESSCRSFKATRMRHAAFTRRVACSSRRGCFQPVACRSAESRRVRPRSRARAGLGRSPPTPFRRGRQAGSNDQRVPRRWRVGGHLGRAAGQHVGRSLDARRRRACADRPTSRR